MTDQERRHVVDLLAAPERSSTTALKFSRTLEHLLRSSLSFMSFLPKSMGMTRFQCTPLGRLVGVPHLTTEPNDRNDENDQSEMGETALARSGHPPDVSHRRVIGRMKRRSSDRIETP